MNPEFLNVIRTRRVIRHMSPRPVERGQVEAVLEAGRWAPVGGNQRVNRFVAIQNPRTLRLLRMVSPGMSQRPGAAIVICIDAGRSEDYRFSASDKTPLIDVGTAMQTMLLAAHAIGLGSGPVSSFSDVAVRVVLNLPPSFSPEMIVCLGYPADVQAPIRAPGKQRVTWQSLTHWEVAAVI